MNRHRAYYPRDDAPQPVGDAAWRGVMPRLAQTPDAIDPGYGADATNTRFRTGKPDARGGWRMVKWGARLVPYGEGLRAIPWGSLDAITEFRDPNSVRWIVFAADGALWRVRQYNAPVRMDMPDGVDIRSPLSFTQAFHHLYLFRGQHKSTLRLTSIDGAWEDLFEQWTAGTYDAGDTVMWGPWLAVAAGALTASALTATLVTTEDHGLVDGQDITIRDAAQTAYNGRWPVTVVDERTVTFRLHAGPTASPATGTVLWSTMRDAWIASETTTETPSSSASDWARDYTVLPNGLHATFVNNRILVPTAWVPGQDATEPGAYGLTVDYLACSLVSDARRFYVSNEFRINQGDADDLLLATKVNPATVLCFKSGSVAQLWNFTGDLSQVRMEGLKNNQGAVSAQAIAAVGKDLVFISSKRGIVSLRVSELGELEGVDIPLSKDIEPWIRRTSWRHADRIRVAYWDNRLYVAMPLDDAMHWEYPIDYALGTHVYDDGIVTGDNLVVGRRYRVVVQPGQTFVCGSDAVVATDAEASLEFAAESTHWSIIDTTDDLDGEPPQLTISGRQEGVNNAVLVYDYEVGAWAGMDQGVSVQEWLVATIDGRDRLMAVVSGMLGFYDQAADGMDDSYHPTAADGVQRNDIQTSFLSRGLAVDVGESKARWASISVATWRAQATVNLITDGVAEERQIASLAPDYTRWVRPAGRHPIDPHAANAPLDDPHRQDYALEYADEGFHLPESGGLTADRMQSYCMPIYIAPTQGKWVQIAFANARGRIRVEGMKLELTAGQRAGGART